MAYCGDGATSEGDFHEAMNFAGVWHVPVVFVVQNNQWAISVPLKKQTHSRTIAQKALAYGFPGIQVDGNDVLAVYAATPRGGRARARAATARRSIECVTYRLGVHTTADDPTKYRSERGGEGLGAQGPAHPLRRLSGEEEPPRAAASTRRSTRRSRAASQPSRPPRPPIRSACSITPMPSRPPQLAAERAELAARLARAPRGREGAGEPPLPRRCADSA